MLKRYMFISISVAGGHPQTLSQEFDMVNSLAAAGDTFSSDCIMTHSSDVEMYYTPPTSPLPVTKSLAAEHLKENHSECKIGAYHVCVLKLVAEEFVNLHG